MTERTPNQRNTAPDTRRIQSRPDARTNAQRPSGARPVQSRPAQRPVSRPAVKEENKSSALSALATNIKPILSVKQDKVETVKKKNSRPFPVSAVVIVTICTLLLMFTVVSYVQINEYTIEVASLRGELSDLVAEGNDLDVKLEQKNDMLEIERIAIEEYGMVKSDQLTKKHISLDQEDKIEVVETEPGEDMTVVSSVMSAIAANFQGLWEYME